MATNIQCIGVLTSGGDAPGMNAAIRAVTRTAIANGIIVKGIYRGYRGLITNEITSLETQSVSNIIQRGGTILKTARCDEFRTPEGRRQAHDVIVEHGIEALVVIGGDGSLHGARDFAQEHNFPIIGLPGTIDNDLSGTDVTIGYDTALNTIMECVDKIRDTASSHERLFFVEVMGRDAGFLALNGALATGSEAAIIPEISLEKDQLAEMIEQGFRKSKNSSIVLVAESEVTGGAMGVAERVKKEYPQFDVRVSILGHLQRGGSPSAQDRILATRMGEAAIEALLEGQRNVMVGLQNDELVLVPFAKAIKKDKPIDRHLLDVRTMKHVPTLLSALRILLSPVLIATADRPPLLAALMLLAGATDAVDGIIARRFDCQTRLGARLDSVADWTFFLALGWVFCTRYESVVRSCLTELVVVLALRLAAIVVGWLRFRRLLSVHTLGNKISAVIAFVLLVRIVWCGPVSATALRIALLFAALTALEELLIIVRSRTPDPNQRSLFGRR